VSAALRARKAAFDAAQLARIVGEHVAFRRHGGELGDVLRAYGDFHRARASKLEWDMSDLHTVVITTHNHARFLPESIESVLLQQWRPLELIVVDDASEDNTQAVLRRLLANLPAGVTSKVLHNKRSLGQTGSVNLATLAARGSALTMVDADDFMLGGTIPIAREQLAQQRAYLFGGGARRFWDDVPAQREIELPPDGPQPTRYEPERVYANPTELNISHTGSTYLRSAWRLVGGYRRIARTRITISPDREFHLRIGALLPMVAIAPDVSHWRTGSSVNRGRFR
jgi:glycosyltransferase involved in cell wall biosynthesis